MLYLAVHTYSHSLMGFAKLFFFIVVSAFFATAGWGQKMPADSSILLPKDSLQPTKPLFAYDAVVQKLLADQPSLSQYKKGQFAISNEKKRTQSEFFFYLLTATLAVLAFLKAIFSKYFTTLFKVFFNSSLKQNQLTDQLTLAKLPSLLLNSFFCLSAGIFAFIVRYKFEGEVTAIHNLYLLPIFILSVAIIYVLKYCILKFTGLLTGQKAILNTYIFIIFLVNKMLGILLVPFSVLIVFGVASLHKPIVLISLLCVAIMFAVRYLKSYSLLQYRIQMPFYQFFLYLLGVEIIPLLVIIKLATQFFNKIN